jgi:ParB family chromosome partitioning protein
MTTETEFKTIANFDAELTAGNTKTAMSQAGARSADLWKVPPENVRVMPGANLRLPGTGRDAHVRWLADQMKLYGFLPNKPLTGYVAIEGGVQVIYLQDGGCRYDAVRLAVSEGAPITTIPMVILDRSSNACDLTIAMFNANKEGKSFNALEKAIGAKRLKSFGQSDTEIAAVIGCTTAYVGQLLTLAGAPKKVRDMVQAGEVSSTNAIKMMGKHKEGASEALDKAVKAAKAKGKGKASAKDDDDSALLARQKRHGPALFALVGRYLDTKPNIPDEFGEELDALFAKVEG